MPPKKGTKRKTTNNKTSANNSNGHGPLAPPDRTTWPGWVEMESEPAFFNVMLKEMGVRGVKVHEVYSLDEEILAFLPKPVHALIFLFRYKDADQTEQEKGTVCPSHVWFANQIPDFACASVALLNIVNNIPGLSMGKELCDFRDFTKEMDPMSRGDAIDSFDFVRQIHNSFARENDLLNADMHVKQKAAKANKKRATAKARETRKQATKTPLKEKSSNTNTAPVRTSGGSGKKTEKVAQSASIGSSPLSDPPESDGDYATPSKSKPGPKPSTDSRRRSERKPKPRQDTFAASATAVAAAEAEEGFHFIAYMPVEGRVWKLDGLDSFPQDMGAYDIAGSDDWMNIAQPALQTRMAMYEGADIEFNLMAVVHDPIVNDRTALLQNVKELQSIGKKLDGLVEDWRELDGVETKKDVVTGCSTDFDISQADIDSTKLPPATADSLEKENDLLKLVGLRKRTMCSQGQLRAAIRDALESSKADDEKARHRRHDYGTFVKSWLGALADQEALLGLLDDG